jgi:hypothetical protein
MSSPSRPASKPASEKTDQTDPLDLPPAPEGHAPDPFDGEDDELHLGEPGGEEAPRGGVTDMLRKAVVAGLGAVFMTEEGIRALVKDLKLPKDMLGYLVGQAERSKTELFRIVSEEMRHFFESPALRREIIRLFSDVTVEIKAEIRLRPDGPDLKVSSGARRTRNKKKR